MIYIDPPYGVRFGSNFQPFVRKAGCRPQRRRRHDPRTTKRFRGVPRHLGARVCIHISPTWPHETACCSPANLLQSQQAVCLYRSATRIMHHLT